LALSPQQAKRRCSASNYSARGASVGANYREAYRARSKSEFVAKCGDSLRELEESAYWLELLVDGGIVPPDKLQHLRGECDELTAIFVTIVKQARDRPTS
jgi:four helix bundle protein